jgi:ligand-binding sensor domain-containing protein/signal transduction histidine kinase
MKHAAFKLILRSHKLRILLETEAFLTGWNLKFVSLVPWQRCSRFCRLAVALFVFGPVLASSVLGLDPAKNLSQYVRQDLTMENGLPTDDIQAVTQTRDGYLWVGTEDGLARYDGAKFAIFDKVSGKLPGNFIYCLFEDASGSLWIGTNGGLVRYRAGRFETLGREAGLADAFVYGIAQDREGTLWMSANYKLWRYRGGTFTCFDPLKERGETLGGVIDVTVDRKDEVWIILKGGVVCRFRENRFEAVPDLAGAKGEPLERISTDSEGAVWISNYRSGAYCYENGQVTFFGQKDGLSHSVTSRIMRDRAGSVWLGTELGLARIANGKCSVLQSDAREPAIAVSAVFEDREGNLWAGTEGKGLHRFTDAAFTSFGLEAGLPGGAVKAVCEDSDHRLWLATSDGVYYRSGDRFVQAIAAKERLGGDLSWLELLPDPRDHSLWIGTMFGLFHYQAETLTEYTTRDGLPSNGVLSLCLDHEGTLWIGCESGLVYLKQGKFAAPDVLQGDTHGAQVRNLVEDHAGGLWIGTASGPILYKDGALTRFGKKDGLSSIACFQIYVGSDGVVWVSTWNGGLSRYTGNGFFTYFQKDGLPSDQIYAVVDDPGRGDLWLGSEKGVFRVNQKTLDDFRVGRIDHIFGTTFGVADGLRSPEINANGKPDVIRTEDGKLWWSLDQGTAVVNPNRLVLHNTVGPTVIQRLTADDHPLANSNPELLPGTRRLEIEYASITYAAAEKVQFRYRLDGVDRNWFNAGSRREAIFTNLGPGNYRFRVQASADGVASWDETAEIAFYVRPYFYETWWFFALCAAAVIFLVWLILTLRRSRLEAHFRAVISERVRVAGEIHDSLAQGFASAAMLLDSLDRLVPQDSPLRLRLKSVRYILGTSLTDARSMIATLRGQTTQREALESELQRLVERLRPISTAPIQLDFAGEAVPAVPVAVKEELIRICQEGINNSIRHANAQQIWVRLQAEDHRGLRLVVGDDGKGFDVGRTTDSSEANHFGLLGIRERAARIGAQFEIRSQPGGGTELKLTLKTGASLTSCTVR